MWNILLHKQLYLVIVSPFNSFASIHHEEFAFKMPQQGKVVHYTEWFKSFFLSETAC